MRTMKHLPAINAKVTNKTANKKAWPQKTKPKPITTWEGEGGVLSPDSGALTNAGGQNQSELQSDSTK